MSEGVPSSTRVIGYAEPLGVAPLESVAFKLSSDRVPAARVEIVRLTAADPDPAGPGIRFQRVADLGVVPVRAQGIHVGSCAVVDGPPPFAALTSFAMTALVWPTLPEKGWQTLLGQWDGRRGYALMLDGRGALACVMGDGEGEPTVVSTGTPLNAREWTRVVATFDAPSGCVALYQQALRTYPGIVGSAAAEGTAPGMAGLALPAPFVIAAHAAGTGDPRQRFTAHFNGKIEQPMLFAGAVAPDELLAAPGGVAARARAAWDLGVPGADPTQVADRSGNGFHARTVNLPARAVTGHDWNGAALDFRLAPTQWGACHFHDDDLYDCAWESDAVWTVPEGTRSGYHAARLTAPGVESWVTFFVRPPRDRATARVAYLAATATYQAYANTHIKFDSLNSENLFESVLTLSEPELMLNERRDLGLSMYDTHTDGSGVIYSSRLRPMLTVRPGLYTFNYVNDTHVIAWLEASGIDHDVITDEDLHAEGAALLSRYPVLITGSHPEYYSTAMWDAVDAYQAAGGRHVALGGNGFYWRIAFHPALPGVIENRRGITGVRTWEGEPGEDHLSFTGEPGGLWRSHGRAPQRLIGVGFSATLFNRSTYYRRLPASFDPAVAFIFEGVGSEERIGDFGRRGGGAAGLEIDRHDRALGSPPNARLLATTENVGAGGLLSVEEFITTTHGLDGEQHGKVRADMVFFPTANGGAVFATGSIAWATSLTERGGDNNVARITRNVVRRFLDPRGFDAD